MRFIAQAAKRIGMSYKTAWDAVDAMNNLADRPLVVRATGGKGGGGTHLTDYGKQVIAGYRLMEAEHRQPGPHGGGREKLWSD